MLRFLYRWRRWIIFVSLVAATGLVWWITTPLPARIWSYDVSELEQPYKLWLQSISPDQRWMVIRRANPLKEQFLDFIDLRTGKIERTWKRNDAERFFWGESKRIVADLSKDEYWLRDSHLIADANPRYFGFNPQTGEEKEITKEEMNHWWPPFVDFFLIHSTGSSELKEWATKNLQFYATPNLEKQSFEFRIVRREPNEFLAEIEIPFQHCVSQGNITGRVIPEHPWLLFISAAFLSERCPSLFKAIPWLARFDHCHCELRLVDWTTGKSECFYGSWSGCPEYLVSSQGFFLHTRNASQHIIEFWPWPVAQRNWWWLLAPWGCALLLWIARRAITFQKRKSVSNPIANPSL